MKNEVQIDPLLLFQRLIAVGSSLTDDTSFLFKYELCTVPSALFEPSGLMRRADKPTLTKSLLNMLNDTNLELSDSVEYVLDGGALLQRLPWKRGMTYSAICYYLLTTLNLITRMQLLFLMAMKVVVHL